LPRAVSQPERTTRSVGMLGVQNPMGGEMDHPVVGQVRPGGELPAGLEVEGEEDSPLRGLPGDRFGLAAGGEKALEGRRLPADPRSRSRTPFHASRGERGPGRPRPRPVSGASGSGHRWCRTPDRRSVRRHRWAGRDSYPTAAARAARLPREPGRPRARRSGGTSPCTGSAANGMAAAGAKVSSRSR
jgi:hypothetical protein